MRDSGITLTERTTVAEQSRTFFNVNRVAPAEADVVPGSPEDILERLEQYAASVRAWGRPVALVASAVLVALGITARRSRTMHTAGTSLVVGILVGILVTLIS